MNTISHFYKNKLFDSKKQFVKVLYDKKFPTAVHDHDFFELIIVAQGKGYHSLENSTTSVSRGDVLVIPPSKVHSFFDAENLEIINILLKTDFIQKRQHKSKNVPGYLKLMEIEPFIRQNNDKSVFLHLNFLQLADLQRDIKFIEYTNALDQIDSSDLQYHTVWKIIYHLSYLLYEQLNKSSPPHTSIYEVQILDTLEYIHQNYSNKITIEMLASHLSLSRSTFLRNFQTLCGCSPMQYLYRHRTQKAMELLNFSKMSKTEIAHECGFYDLSHMERHIKSNSHLLTK